MARPLRVEYTGAFYHVINRGNAGEDIFKGRFKYLLVDADEYLKHLSRYIHLEDPGKSPVDTGQGKEEKYRSRRGHLSFKKPHPPER